jgi:glycosidase
MATWLGNQDVPRPIHSASRHIPNCRQTSTEKNNWAHQQPQDSVPYERLATGFAVLLTNPGLPLIYYGDEIGLAGGGDPDNRRMMPWNDQDLNAHQLTLRDRVTTLNKIRSTNKAITRGRRVTLHKNPDSWVYTMVGCGPASPNVTVAINRADTSITVPMPEGAFTDLLTEQSVSGGEQAMGPRSYLIWQHSAQ